MWTQDDRCIDWAEKYIKHRYSQTCDNSDKENLDSGRITIFDIGFNEGEFSKLIYKKIGKQTAIVAFEPNLNVADLNLDYIKLINKAVSDQDGQKMTLHVPVNALLPNQKISGISALHNRDVFSQYNVEKMEIITTTVDSTMQELNIDYIDFLKIDTEGHEFNVLKGANNALKNRRISCGQFEWGCTFEECDYTLDDVVHYLNQFGYECFLGPIENKNKLINGSAGSYADSQSPDRWENILFVNSELI